MSVVLGSEEVKGSPPDIGTWLFFDGSWIQLATDSSDGVPRTLTFEKPEATKASMEKDWAEYDAEHPYVPHPRTGVAGGSHDEHGGATEHVATASSPADAARAVNELAGRVYDYSKPGDYEQAPGKSKSVGVNRTELISKCGSTGRDIVNGVKDYTGPEAAHENGLYMKTLEETARNAPLSTQELYRGMPFSTDLMGGAILRNTELENSIALLKVGDTIPLRGMSSFTSSSDHAGHFSDSPAGGVDIVLEPGAHALNVSGISNTPGEGENLVTGALTVLSVESHQQGLSALRYIVHARQS